MSNRKKIPARLRYRILERDGFRCRYCGATPDDEGVKLEVDHLTAYHTGGTEDPDNLITSCRECNRGKSGRLREEDFGVRGDFDFLADSFATFSPDAFVIDDGPTLETPFLPEGRSLTRAEIKREMRLNLQRQSLAEVVPQLPQPGHQIHVVSNARYDFWTFIPHVIELLGRSDHFQVSTWTMNRQACADILALFDAGKIGTIDVLTGIYFKRRESANYAMILEGIQARKQRYIASKNHTKVILLDRDPHYLTIEGSANLTANPRLEQYVMTNDRQLWGFHRSWFEELLTT